MKIGPGTVVVVTGGSAGVGRAIADACARRGAKVAVLAREPQRLEQTRSALLALGAEQVLAIPTDVADEAQVEAACDRIERELGPIDVWVNNAMVTLVAPVSETTPEELRRVTEVTYHGAVWGTMAALRRMRGRNRGSIVQVGSALSYRPIPLQAAYCGAKHAMLGFTDALRSELIQEGSAIHLAMVQLPAVNTPQFEWCRTRMAGHPRPMGTIYQPELIADAVLYAAEGHRRELFVTISSANAIWGDKLIPRLLDRFLARTAYPGQQMRERVAPDRKDNLFEPVPGPWGAHGRFDEQAKPASATLWLNLHRNWLLASTAALLAVGAVAAGAGRKGLRR
ncbi:SDR family oxidoreductase [Ramlibacter sp. AN1015]|uniref:SDR family oxidoreductase n=1 Tax=Ramlibacter sp. AN1015 TaxID=3133428 RepID=UPI0030BC2CCB